MTFLQCITRLVTDLKSQFAAIVHTHAASDITSGTLALARGGTGGTDSETARTNLDAAQSGGALGSLHNAELMLVNSVETGSAAVSEHQRGAYFWWNYRLVRATKNISVGNTISIGGNVENAYGMKEMTTLRESIAPVESVIAMSNHAVGDYFMLGNVLMKATAAIATGEQITTSKATPVTIQSQIDTLRDSVSVVKNKLTFTPNSGVTVTNFTDVHFGNIIHIISLDCCFDSAQPAGKVSLGTVSGNVGGGLGSARVSKGGVVAYEGTAQLSSNGSVVVYNSVEASLTYYLTVMWLS